jgi:cell division protein ZapA
MNTKEEKDLKINIAIGGLRFPIIINRDKEEIYRKAGKCVEKYIEKYQKEYPLKDAEEILCLVALKLSIAVHEMDMNHRIEN